MHAWHALPVSHSCAQPASRRREVLQNLIDLIPHTPWLQAATIQSIGCMGFMNVGVQLGLAGHSAAAGAALAVSGVCAGFVLWGFRRVKVRGRGSCAAQGLLVQSWGRW